MLWRKKPTSYNHSFVARERGEPVVSEEGKNKIYDVHRSPFHQVTS